ncbi:phosphotransferase [Aeromicrobium sp.]|uniref:phosphotransferase n=1 Tax=Aeromicrobium sp. TaxID=1871063 RepID=UPI0019959579|nr:phosphotransferase [Aeromicrobium sp.]MBC7632256.1 phosphotransferase [Aeromicrobium sp.]
MIFHVDGSRPTEHHRSFPRSAGDVTAGWLTEVLVGSRALEASSRVSAFSRGALASGFGMHSETVRLHLTHTQAPGTLPSVVAKFASLSEVNLATARRFRSHEREVRFFRDLAGGLGDSIPQCFHAEIELSTGEFVLLLDDGSGYRQGDQAVGCDVRDAEAVITALARLHAQWWGRRNAQTSWVPTVDGELHVDGLLSAARSGWHKFVDEYGSDIGPQIIEAGPRYLAAAPRLHEAMGRSPQTLVHGDCRLDNILFGAPPDQSPVLLLDWQAVMTSKGAHDLAYFLSMNLDSQLRRDHERDLLALYVARLRSLGVCDYSVEQCWEDYRLAVLWPFEYAIVIGSSLDLSDARASRFARPLVQRSANAIVDLDLLSLIEQH